MRGPTSLRDAVHAAYAAIAEDDAAARAEPIADGALEAVLAPGTRAVLAGDRSALLDLVGLLALRLGAEGPVVVVCGPERPATLARSWLHARARVARSARITREGWQRLSAEVGRMAELDVSFSESLPDPERTSELRGLLLLCDVAPAWIDTTLTRAATVVVASSPFESPGWRLAWLEHTDATACTLHVAAGGREAATELYYERATGFFARLEPDAPSSTESP